MGRMTMKSTRSELGYSLLRSFIRLLHTALFARLRAHGKWVFVYGANASISKFQPTVQSASVARSAIVTVPVSCQGNPLLVTGSHKKLLYCRNKTSLAGYIRYEKFVPVMTHVLMERRYKPATEEQMLRAFEVRID